MLRGSVHPNQVGAPIDREAQLAAKIPIVRPGNVTSSEAPSVLTRQDDVRNDADGRRISFAVRGGPRTRFDAGLPSVCGGTYNGASQNAYQRFFAITSGVISMPAARSGSACCRVMRRTPVTTWYSGVRFSPRTAHAAPELRMARSRMTGRPSAKRQPHPQFATAIALPGQDQQVVSDRRGQAFCRLGPREIAAERFSSEVRGSGQYQESREGQAGIGDEGPRYESAYGRSAYIQCVPGGSEQP